MADEWTATLGTVDEWTAEGTPDSWTATYFVIRTWPS